MGTKWGYKINTCKVLKIQKLFQKVSVHENVHDKCIWKKTQIITEFGVVYISLLVQNINIFWLNNYAAIKKKSAVWQNKHEDFQK